MRAGARKSEVMIRKSVERFSLVTNAQLMPSKKFGREPINLPGRRLANPLQLDSEGGHTGGSGLTVFALPTVAQGA